MANFFPNTYVAYVRKIVPSKYNFPTFLGGLNPLPSGPPPPFNEGTAYKYSLTDDLIWI